MRFGDGVRALWLGAVLVCAPLLLLLPTSPAASATAAAVAVAVLVASFGLRRPVTATVCAPPSTAPPTSEERRLRGAFRRQSAPDTPGCPRRPRAPGRVPAA